MAEITRDNQVVKDIILTTQEGYLCGVNPDNISCFYRRKYDERLTRVFLKHSNHNDLMDVVESPEEIMAMIDIPVVELDCHPTEDYCKKVFVAAANIAGYVGKSMNPVRCDVSFRHQENNSYFCVAEDAKTIRDKIYAALSGAKPNIG